MIKFTYPNIPSEGVSVDCLVELSKAFPDSCYVVDADKRVVRMAEND